MRRLLLSLLLLAPLDAATYYVSSAGSDSNMGTSMSPWLTLNKALTTIACGDTVNIVANGSFVAGDGNLPYFTGCSSTTTIQSSALAMFQPVGYRTNPVNDTANYGKLRLTSQGIHASVEAHGSGACIISALSSSVFTVGFCNSGWQNIANGTQVFFEIDSEGNNAATAISSNLTILQRYYIVNCVSCGTANTGTFQVSATLGGSPITTACSSPCIVGALRVGAPVQVNTVTNTLTSPDAFTVMTTNTPVYVAASGLQLNTLTTPAMALPAPLQVDTQYFMVSVSGRQFKLSATSGGPAIPITTVGTGTFQMSDARAPHDWKFDGLELRQANGSLVRLFFLGFGNEASTLGMVNHIEVSRSWLHEDPADEAVSEGPQSGIAFNGAYGNFHDNYIAGMSGGEAQAIVGWGTPGPVLITNNFLEGSGENTLYGGAHNSSGVSNANILFTGNYYFKPPAWRVDSAVGVPSGACWYSAVDPNHTGGQWYTNTGTGTKYRCNASSVWATTMSTPPTGYTIKTMAEHKSLRASSYIGNVFDYNWGSSQSGQAFNMGQQQGSGPGMANDTITVQNNKINHVLMFGNFFADSCFMTVAVPCQTALLPHNFTISNNLVVQEQAACGVPSVGGTAGCGWHMYTIQHSGYPPIGFNWNHNTAITLPDGIAATFPWDSLASLWEPTVPLTFSQSSYRNSIVGYDFQGNGNCGAAISSNFTFSTFDRIANPNATCASYTGTGATNTFTNWSPQTTNAGVGFVDLSGEDYRLATTSPYSASCMSGCAFVSSDGTDIGADIDAIAAATSGAVLGTPTWATQMSFTVTPSATGAIATYTRPGSDPCDLTVYNAPARIAANENADTNTAMKKLDTRTGNTVMGDNVTFVIGFNSPLNQSTTYWYTLSCVAADMSVWKLAGDSFTTTALTSQSVSARGKIVVRGLPTVR